MRCPLAAPRPATDRGDPFEPLVALIHEPIVRVTHHPLYWRRWRSLAGRATTRFEAVRAAFVDNFDDGEIGAACSIVVDGPHGRRPLGRLGGRRARRSPGRRTRSSTPTRSGSRSWRSPCCSSSRRATSTSTSRRRRGGPNCSPGSRARRCATLLCHRRACRPSASRSRTRRSGTGTRWPAAVAGTEPWWPPGTRHGYHDNTYGFLAGELARRVTGTLPGDWLRTEIAGPLGADLAWGLSPADQARCADVVWQSASNPPTGGSAPADLPDEQAMLVARLRQPAGLLEHRRREHAGVARHPGAVDEPARDGARRRPALRRAGRGRTARRRRSSSTRTSSPRRRKPQSEGWCPFLERDVTFGLGFQPTRPDRPFGPNPGASATSVLAVRSGSPTPRRRRLRLRHERGQAPLAELPQPRPRRRVVRQPLNLPSTFAASVRARRIDASNRHPCERLGG